MDNKRIHAQTAIERFNKQREFRIMLIDVLRNFNTSLLKKCIDLSLIPAQIDKGSTGNDRMYSQFPELLFILRQYHQFRVNGRNDHFYIVQLADIDQLIYIS